MAEQWIDAANAFRLVAGSFTPPSGAGDALLRRAKLGLVQAKARVLIRDDERSKDAPVPADFWSSKRLAQHWLTGDFAGKAGVLGTDNWQAVDVTFALSGVLELLPFELRAVTARQLSVAGNTAWIPAGVAVLLVPNPQSRRSGAAAILEYARLGFATGRAVLAKRFLHEHLSSLLWEEREWSIPPWFWQSCVHTEWNLQNWELGQFQGEVPGSSGAEWMHLSGVHLLIESLETLIDLSGDAQPADAPEVAAPETSKTGGRPPQSWWDEMWCDVWGVINQGDFKPETQADVERAMLTWAEKHGYRLGETTARLKARKLFNAYEEEVENFLGDGS